MLFRLSTELCASNRCIYQSKRFVNARIARAGMLKLERTLKRVEEKINEYPEIQPEPVRRTKQEISNTIQIIEGQDVYKKRIEILNKSYLESISEIISNHANFDKLPRLNINSVETNPILKHVKVFWNFTENDPSKIEEYSKVLNDMIPDIQLSLRQDYYRNSSPLITFYYDIYDGVNTQMEYLYSSVKDQTAKIEKEPFDPAKLFTKEKLIKKEFNMKSVVLRDPSADFPRDEMHPTKFKHPYEMNLFACKLDFKRIYEYILVQISQGKSKRTLGKPTVSDETSPSVYVSPPIFKHSDLGMVDEFEMPLTDERIKLMKQFVISNKKKSQHEYREVKKEDYERREDDFEKNLEAKRNMDERYSEDQ